VIQASYRGGEYKFYFSRERSVIQAFLRGEKCNLLFKE